MSTTLLHQGDRPYETFRKSCVITLSIVEGDVQIRFGPHQLYMKHSPAHRGLIVRKVHKYFIHVRIHPRSAHVSLREYSTVYRALFTKTLARLEVPKDDKLESVIYLMDTAEQM